MGNWRYLFLGLVTVAAYNLCLWQRDRRLLARLRTERLPMPRLSHTPKVSALVAAWNEHDTIDAHIRSFLALTYPNIELILCAGGVDDTLECARRYANERVIVLEQQPGEGKQQALARCFAHASGEIIYLTDADCIFTDEALIRLLAPLVDEGEQAATGRSRPLDEQLDQVLPSYLWASDVVSSVHRSVYSTGLLGRNAAVTRQALERIGGLNFTAKTGTDYQLGQRLIAGKIAIRYVNASIVPSEYPKTLRAYRAKQSRWLRNLLIYGPSFRASGDAFEALKTVVSGLLMVLALPAMAIFGNRVMLPWSLILAHATSSKLRYILFTAQLFQRPISARLLASLAPLRLIDFAVWALPIFDLINPKRREQW